MMDCHQSEATMSTCRNHICAACDGRRSFISHAECGSIYGETARWAVEQIANLWFQLKVRLMRKFWRKCDNVIKLKSWEMAVLSKNALMSFTDELKVYSISPNLWLWFVKLQPHKLNLNPIRILYDAFWFLNRFLKFLLSQPFSKKWQFSLSLYITFLFFNLDSIVSHK